MMSNQQEVLMPRKSRELRLTQAIETVNLLKQAGLGNDRSARFLSDMIYKMQRGKYPTARQRNWIDAIIEEGVPAPKGDQAYIAKIDDALSVPGIDFANILTDFRGKIVKGWSLSEKQIAFCNKLIKKATDIRDGNIWVPDEELKSKLELAVKCEGHYASIYWSTHPGGYNALQKVKRWLSGEAPFVEQYATEKLLKTVAGSIKKLTNPKFAGGEMCFVGRNNDIGIVMSSAYPGPRSVVYDVLVNGTLIQVESPKKRRS